MGNIAEPCAKCGGTVFYSDGACKSCSDVSRQRTIARRLTDGPLCLKCGGCRDSDGRCVACRRARRQALAMERSVCAKCGASDMDSWGHCKPCKANRQSRVVAEALPCTSCGQVDRSASGKCRECARRSGAARRDRAAPCRSCGANDWTKEGKCRRCISRRMRERKYGFDRGGFDARLKAQGGKCAACRDSFDGLPSKHVHVDHDHVTGEVRGILCHACNTAIGLLLDSPSRASKIADYLRRHTPSLPFAKGA